LLEKICFADNLYDPKSDEIAGITNLMSAITNKDIEGVKFFSKYIGSSINQKNIGGATALHIACREGEYEMVRILLDNKSNVNVSDNEGWTPLMRASLSKSYRIVDLLLKNNADIATKNVFNESAIIHSAQSGCEDCVKIIIENSKNLIEKEQFVTALTAAQKQENKIIQKFLQEHIDKFSKPSNQTKTNNSQDNNKKQNDVNFKIKNGDNEGVFSETNIPKSINDLNKTENKLGRNKFKFILSKEDKENKSNDLQNMKPVVEKKIIYYLRKDQNSSKDTNQLENKKGEPRFYNFKFKKNQDSNNNSQKENKFKLLKTN
jgi:ankyrin repeat protein